MFFRLLLLLFLCSCGYPPASGFESPSSAPLGVSRDLPKSPDNYDRSSWGRWKDLDNNGLDTRQEVLIEESTVAVTVENNRVVRGRWVDKYTGDVITDPSKMDIDHLVSLKEAHDAGAWHWDRATKIQFFNDLSAPHHLLAVGRSVNRSKGSRTPEFWMPPNSQFHCQYLLDKIKVLEKYRLCVDWVLYDRWLVQSCPPTN